MARELGPTVPRISDQHQPRAFLGYLQNDLTKHLTKGAVEIASFTVMANFDPNAMIRGAQLTVVGGLWLRGPVDQSH